MTLEEFVNKFRNRLFLYHFTDTRNLESIQRLGLLSLRRLGEEGVIVPAPGGNDWSNESAKARGLDRYVSLCFREGHPMAYKAEKEGHICDVRYLKIGLDVLLTPGVVFTPGVSNKAGMEQFDWERAKSEFDWEVLYTRMDWRNPEINARLQAASKYEALVPDIVPPDLIKNL